jgi:hypothetical protein
MEPLCGRTMGASGMVALMTVAATGCSRVDLEGRWTGEVDCGAGASHVNTFDLHARAAEDEWRGEGRSEWLCQDAKGQLLDCELTYVADVALISGEEGKLEMVLTDCVAVVGSDEYTSPCFEPWDMQTDGFDHMDGYWDECLFDAQR